MPCQENHSQDILPDIKRYRQSIFKINYKLKQKAAAGQDAATHQWSSQAPAQPYYVHDTSHEAMCYYQPLSPHPAGMY